MKNKGFTLIELMIVVAIIAILAAVAAPKFGMQIKKSKDAKGLAVVGVLRSASTVEYADKDGVAETSYANLKNKIDDKSAALVTPTGTNDVQAFVKVGYNSVAKNGDNTFIELTAVSTTDGTLDIAASNGLDAKSTTWSSY